MAGANHPFERQTLKGHGPFDSANLIDLVLPLPHKGTAMHTAETTHTQSGRSGAISALINDRSGDIDSENQSAREAYAWIQNFNNGNQNNNWKNNNNRARAVRSSYQTEPLPSFQELVEAYFECRKGKRNSETALAFEANLERNLCALHASLINRTYTPGRSICFVITRPKPREVWAAEFVDRIVHHLLYRRIGPRFENSFIKGPDDLYAMPNKEVAEKCAKAHTKSIGPWIEVEHAKGSMLWLNKDTATVEVIHWPHSDEEFEEQLKEFNPKDWGLEEDKANHE